MAPEQFNGAAAWEFFPALRQCPKSLVDAEADYHVRVWLDWKALRILPHEGELADQPAWVVDMIQRAENAFEEERARRQKLTLAEMERNNAARSRGGT